MSCYGDFSDVYIKLSHVSFQGFEKRSVLVLSDSKSNNGRIIRNITSERHSHILEETRRIQNPMQFAGKKKTSEDKGQLLWCRHTLCDDVPDAGFVADHPGLASCFNPFKSLSKTAVRPQSLVWGNCDGGKDPVAIKSLTVQPNLIVHTGSVTVSAQTQMSVTPDAPSKVELTSQKEVASFWVKVLCVKQIGI